MSDVTPSRSRLPVAVLGATGTVGQRFVALLEHHPWFELVAVTGSERSIGKPYGEAARWMQSTPLPPSVAELVVQPSVPTLECTLVFSALDAGVAGPIEVAFAEAGSVVVSNARSHRYDPDVPLLVPEVNAEHLDIVREQRFGPGCILTNPNCSTIGLTLALKPLADAFGLSAVHIVTLQAISGAGLPGVASLEIFDNVVPYIGSEEEKIERETRKILGHFDGSRIVDAELRISAACNRVPVVDGHTECVSVALERPASAVEIREAFESFQGLPQVLRLPTAPAKAIHYHERVDSPQPRLHRDLDGGMATSIGRLRPCGILDWKFVLLSHNTIRGAAGGALLVGELAVARDLVPGFQRPTTGVPAARTVRGGVGAAAPLRSSNERATARRAESTSSTVEITQ